MLYDKKSYENFTWTTTKGFTVQQGLFVSAALKSTVSGASVILGKSRTARLQPLGVVLWAFPLTRVFQVFRRHVPHRFPTARFARGH